MGPRNFNQRQQPIEQSGWEDDEPPTGCIKAALVAMLITLAGIALIAAGIHYA